MKYITALVLLMLVASGCKKDKARLVAGDYLMSGLYNYPGPAGWPDTHAPDTIDNKIIHISRVDGEDICEDFNHLCPTYYAPTSTRSTYVFLTMNQTEGEDNCILTFFGGDSLDYIKDYVAHLPSNYHLVGRKIR